MQHWQIIYKVPSPFSIHSYMSSAATRLCLAPANNRADSAEQVADRPVPRRPPGFLP